MHKYRVTSATILLACLLTLAGCGSNSNVAQATRISDVAAVKLAKQAAAQMPRPRWLGGYGWLEQWPDEPGSYAKEEGWNTGTVMVSATLTRTTAVKSSTSGAEVSFTFVLDVASVKHTWRFVADDNGKATYIGEEGNVVIPRRLQHSGLCDTVIITMYECNVSSFHVRYV